MENKLSESEIDTEISKLEVVVDKIKKLFNMTIEARGEWHKDFVSKLINSDLDMNIETARGVLGIACDYMSVVYIQGHERGYNQGYADGLKKASKHCGDCPPKD